MSEEKFTPGPWVVDLVHPQQIIRNVEKTNLIRIASTNKRFGNFEANARLMALAPQFYAQLRSNASLFRSYFEAHRAKAADPMLTPTGRQERLDKAQTNLAQAEAIEDLLERAHRLPPPPWARSE